MNLLKTEAHPPCNDFASSSFLTSDDLECIWPSNLAERMECAQLAAAFVNEADVSLVIVNNLAPAIFIRLT